MSLAKTGAKRKRDDGDQETWECRRLGSASGTGNELDHLVRNLRRLGRSLNIPLTHIEVPYFNEDIVSHPVLSMQAFLQFMISKGHAAKFLGGYNLTDTRWKTLLQQYWLKYRNNDPSHSVFEDFETQQNIVPLMAYGDEGTGKRKHAVWVLGWKPVLFCRMTSWWRTFLYTVMPHQAYAGFHCGASGGNLCLDAVMESFAKDATKLYQEGFQLANWGFTQSGVCECTQMLFK